MQILHIAHSSEGNPESRMIAALVKEQVQQGHKAYLTVQHSGSEQEGIIPMEAPLRPWEQTLLQRQEQQGMYDFYAPQLLALLNRQEFQQADIVHLHTVDGGYFSHLLLPFLAAKPLVWTLYNERPFFEAPPTEGGRAAAFRNICRQIQELVPCTVVAAQPWLRERLRHSPLAAKQTAEIGLGVDLNFWLPQERQEARKSLGLPDKPVLLLDRSALRAAKTLRSYGWLPIVLDSESEDAYTLRTSELKAEGLRNLYSAADLFVCLDSAETTWLQRAEAAACGLPLAVPQRHLWQYSWLKAQQSGLVLSMNSSEALQQLAGAVKNREALHAMRSQARANLEGHPWNVQTIAKTYQQLYQTIASSPKTQMQEVPAPAPAMQLSDKAIQFLCAKHLDLAQLESLRRQGWSLVWDELQEKVKEFTKEDDPKRGTFIDAFLLYCLQIGGKEVLWDVTEQWIKHRKMPSRSGHLKDEERAAALLFAREVREIWKSYLCATSQGKMAKVDVIRQSRMVTFWRLLFLNDASIIYLDAGRNETLLPVPYRTAPPEAFTGKVYPDLLLRSMYQPYGEIDLSLDMEGLIKSTVPLAVKVIVPFWLSSAPYFNNDKEVQQAALRHIRNYCQAALRHPQAMPKGLFEACVEHFTQSLWRLSYSGGNMNEESSAFGDFLHGFMKLFYPRWHNYKLKSRGKRKKLRIGYISSNFRNQAVSFYMANRILHADKTRFETFIFSLERRCDEMTERIKETCDRYIAITDFKDVDAMAQTLVDSQLDVLIYTDIGMDPLTYKLAALQLAPLQAVLVGHGVTTGLPTMQYYLSGDFESAEADSHYREKLVRLPRLGAAQFAPFEPDTTRTRRDFNLPEDKVIFVSCANGIKHGPARDHVLVEILKQAPNAYIALKPFMMNALVDMHFVDRVMQLAKEAGVSERLRIVPPLPKNTDLLALLRVCDVNLDTYPYGGWTTNMDALYVGLPVVTQEGSLARTRWGAGMLRVMGIQEGIAQNEEEYIAWAVRFAKDEALRVRVRAQIENKAKEILFSGNGTQNEYELILEQIVALAGKNNKK